MNFLAHLYLADDSPESRIGNLMPDMVRGKLPSDLHPAVNEGVKRHRRVDRMTDTHAVVARSKQRIVAGHGIFSGILIDVFYDHYLARDWSRWHEQTLHQFTIHVYQQMSSRPDLMPQPMRDVICKMAQQDWLTGYAHIEGMTLTMQRMSKRFEKRLRRTFDADKAIADLLAFDAELQVDFEAFFPQLMQQLGLSHKVASREDPV